MVAWDQTLPLDPITPKRFRNLVLLDGNFDPKGLRLAVVDGEVVGLVYAVRRLMPMVGTELELVNGWRKGPRYIGEARCRVDRCKGL